MYLVDRWFKISETERYFLKLSLKNTAAIKSINELNEQRREVQKKIAALNQLNSKVCMECTGECCKGDYNHFTIIDYLIRMHSQNPIKSWGNSPAFPSFVSRIYDKIKSIIKKEKNAPYITGRTTKCPELGNESCNLMPEDRPLRCILWTCSIFRDNFTPEKLKELGQLYIELKKIIKRTMKIYGSFA